MFYVVNHWPCFVLSMFYVVNHWPCYCTVYVLCCHSLTLLLYCLCFMLSIIDLALYCLCFMLSFIFVIVCGLWKRICTNVYSDCLYVCCHFGDPCSLFSILETTYMTKLVLGVKLQCPIYEQKSDGWNVPWWHGPLQRMSKHKWIMLKYLILENHAYDWIQQI
jgi:hypothetical protein